MTFTDNNADYVFSKGMKDITITLESGETDRVVYVTPYYEGQEQNGFNIQFFAGKAIIRLAEMAEAFVCPLDYRNVLDNDDVCFMLSLRELSIQVENYNDQVVYSMTFHVLPGGNIDAFHNLENSPSSYRFLTHRDMSATAMVSGREVLAAFFPTTVVGLSEITEVRILVHAYFDDGTASDADLANYSDASGKIIVANLDYSIIMDLFDTTAEMLAYDVSIRATGTDSSGNSVTKTTHETRRFVFPSSYYDSSVHNFMFINSQGAIDNVYSSGRIVRKIKNNVTSFIRDREEKVLESLPDVQITVNTGILRTAREWCQWKEFIMSTEQYTMTMEPADTWNRIIIDEAEASGTIGETGSIEFTYHYAKASRDTYLRSQLLTSFSQDESGF